jgi:hypothetical protein
LSSIIGILLGIVKAVPVIDKWVEMFLSAYFAMKISEMKRENVDAIRKLIEERDQRDFERAIGSPKAGLPSGDSGSEFRDAPPRM